MELAQLDRQGPRNTATIRVLVVDDHHTFADLLAIALETEAGFECVGTAAGAAAALEIAVRTRPDIVVMDIDLGPDSGLAAARRIRDVLPETVVVVVSAHCDPSWVAQAAQAGASAFAAKSGSLKEMVAVLRSAENGSMLVGPTLFTPAPQPATQRRTQVDNLTARELDVLVLMGKGAAPSEIARVLGITVNTCRGYVKAVHTKLAVRSQLEAVLKAQRLGLITTSDDR
ncbi:MAG: two component transcriptional regulator, LuxR family [Pseudonocardiales bacterium]|nr:two component transcriptional regulator, LuxR family [Pseudonocardiales bacterium]